MSATTYTGRRITPDEVEAAYRETGIEPVRFGYVSPTTRCVLAGCGLGAMICQTLGIKKGSPVRESVRASWLLGLSPRYVFGFVRGFDNADKTLNSSPDFVAGYRDGSAAASRVFTGATKS